MSSVTEGSDIHTYIQNLKSQPACMINCLTLIHLAIISDFFFSQESLGIDYYQQLQDTRTCMYVQYAVVQ